ncbi:MAG: phosphoribosylaminoimidazolesuccinocarboxamide synthase [Phycisphaerales bacterium]
MLPVIESSLNLPGLRRGKVRDVYQLPHAMLRGVGGEGAAAKWGISANDQLLLIVASDRISAFDVVMPTPIPGKGRLLTQLSLFWLRMIEDSNVCKTHLLSSDVNDLRDEVFKGSPQPRDAFAGRIMIARAAKVVPIECVVRGYIEGSGWKEYQATGSICGVQLPKALRQCDKLPQPIFTPATKEELGKHDENVTFERAAQIVGEPLMKQLRETSLAIYSLAATHAHKHGIIIADTKFEFGLLGNQVILIDEALTPDSSRFWPAATYSPGKAQQSYDKQYLREYLESLVAKGQWNKQAPGPTLPESIVAATRAKYEEAQSILARK